MGPLSRGMIEMAKPTTSVPESATNRPTEGPQDSEEAIEAILEAYDADYASAVEYTDELKNIIETAILVLASADDDEVEYVTTTIVTLVEAADSVSTDGTVALAEGVGENADDLADILEAVVALQQQGHVDTYVGIAETLAESMDEETAEELATVLGDNGSEAAAAMDSVLELQREGYLDDLLALAKMVSVLKIDESTVNALNRVLNAVEEAEEESEPVGLLGMIRSFGQQDVRTSLGYIMSVLKALGSQLRKAR